jgi:hypothetical protein
MDQAGLTQYLVGREPEAVIRTFAMMAYNPAIGRVLEGGSVVRFAPPVGFTPAETRVGQVGRHSGRGLESPLATTLVTYQSAKTCSPKAHPPSAHALRFPACHR